MNIAVIGNGLVGSVIASDLATNFKVSVFDNNEKNFLNDELKYIKFDVLNDDFSVFNDFDLLVLAIPGSLAFNVLKRLIKVGKNIVDISFFPERAIELNNLAIEHNVSVVVDCGVAPGLSNMMLASHVKDEKVESYKCFVGGLPFERKHPWEYKAPFSPTDVLEEYTRSVYIRKNGKIQVLEPMSGIEQINIDSIGTLDAFYTDGLRSLLDSYPDVPDMEEKTLRYPGYIQKIQFLKDAGFLDTNKIDVNGVSVSPFDLTSKLLIDDWKLADDMEFTAMRVDVKTDLHSYEYNLFDNRDVISGFSSMARTTGFTANAVVNLFSESLITDKGIIFPEKIGESKELMKKVYDYLEDRNIFIDVTQK